MKKNYSGHSPPGGIPKGFFLAMVLTALLFAAVPARAQQTPAPAVTWGNFSPFLTLTDQHDAYDVVPYVYVTSDPDRKFSYKDIYERHTSGLRGEPVRGTVLTLGAAAVPRWVVFSVDNQSWNEDWVMFFGQHLDGRIGTISHVFLYEHFSQTRYIDNITQQKNSFVAKAKEIEPSVPVKIAKGKKALFVMFVEPSPGAMVTLAPRLMTAATFDRIMSPPFNKTVVIGFFFLMMAGVFLGAFLFERNFSCLFLALYYAVQTGFLYYQNNTLYIDFPFSVQVGGILIASTGVIGLVATKSLLHVGRLQRAQGRSVSIFIIALFSAAVLGSFIIPAQGVVRPLVVYGAVLASYGFLALLSLAQGYRGQTGAYRFAAAWGLALAGLCFGMIGASGVVPSSGLLVAAYWYSLVPQGLLLASAVSGIIRFEEHETQVHISEESEERERMDHFRQSKESTEIVRLRKLIEHEREVMNELRDREVKQNEEMRKAKETADEANRAKSAFLAVISHEIRTPMTGIMGMVRLLQETMLTGEQREYAQTIQDSGDAMVSLLNDILDFEKIESGKMDLEHLDFDLHRLLNGIITLMSGHAAAKGISLKLEMDRNLPRYVVGDPVRLRQVLLNLTGNSIKFTTEGSVTLQARLDQSAESRMEGGVRKIYFGVKDTGIGISKAAQKNLFNPFAQADSTITRKFGGTGLGLAISQRLIDAMGGRIQIDSVEGHGSTFYFIVVMEEGSADNAARQAGAARGKMEKSDVSLRIMIVEDNEINQRLLKEFVDRMGHQVSLAGSGEDAMKMMADKEFNLVLMDIELPGMSGMGTTKAIRAMSDKKKAATPVIALSGNVRDEDIRSCYAANMNGHLSKPVDPKRLKQMIDKVISGALDNPVIVEEVKVETHLQTNKLGSTGLIEPKPEDSKSVPAPAAEEMEDNTRSAPIIRLAMTAESLSFKPEELDEDSFDVALKSGAKEENNISVQGREVFDSGQMKGLCAGLKPEALGELMKALLDKAEEIVAVLYGSVGSADVKTIAARAHELKGMAGNFGLEELGTLAGDIEKSAREGSRSDELLMSLPAANARAKSAIEAWLHNNPQD